MCGRTRGHSPQAQLRIALLVAMCMVSSPHVALAAQENVGPTSVYVTMDDAEEGTAPVQRVDIADETTDATAADGAGSASANGSISASEDASATTLEGESDSETTVEGTAEALPKTGDSTACLAFAALLSAIVVAIPLLVAFQR